ncbi:hypothetical protein LIER_34880 [Lithospermum erythrorhizon]|uniref:Uncharacterized protein n=1 Tax=Lithospermum erythrorhizon TaxID=34254 RepID=A0AAV3S3X7_LITER
MNDCVSEYTETENLEDLWDVHDIQEPVLLSEQPTEQPLEEQLPVDLSVGVEFVKQPNSMGVDGSTSDSGDGARVPELEMGRGKRVKVSSVIWQDYVTNTAQKLNFLVVITACSEPKSFKEAMQHPNGKRRCRRRSLH